MPAINAALSLQSAVLRVTGTELQTGFATPLTILSAITGKRVVPVAWYADYVFNTAAYTVNTTLQLLVGAVVLGTATNAISGGTSKLTVGTVPSAIVASATALQVGVATGDPAGGNAAAYCDVTVFYVIV